MWIIGVDPSTEKLAFVASNTITGQIVVSRLFIVQDDERESHAYNNTSDFIGSLNAVGESVHFFLEQPIYWRGGKSTIPLAQISGATKAAAQNAGAKVTMVNNSKWKSHVIGGKVDKPKIAQWVKDNLPDRYADANGDQDVLDAVCIHEYAKQVMARRSKLRRTK